jgi:hypothetical protein
MLGPVDRERCQTVPIDRDNRLRCIVMELRTPGPMHPNCKGEVTHEKQAYRCRR